MNCAGRAIAAGISGEERETLSDAAKGSGGISVAAAEGEGSRGREGDEAQRGVGGTRGAAWLGDPALAG